MAESLESQGFTLPESEQYLRETFPDYVKMSPQDRQSYLNEVHYGPAYKSPEDKSSIMGGMGAEVKDIAKSAIPTTPIAIGMKLADPTGVIQNSLGQLGLMGRAAKDVVSDKPTAIKGLHVAEALSPFGGQQAAELEDKPLREAIGRGGVEAWLMAAPMLGGKLWSATKGPRTAIAERTAQSMIGPTPKGTAPVSEPAPAFVKEAPVAATRGGLTKAVGEKIGGHQETLNRTLQASQNAPPENLPSIVHEGTQPIIDEARSGGYENVAKAIEGWRDNYLNQHSPDVSLPELYKLRQDMGGTKDIFKGARASNEEASVNHAAQEVYRAMNRALDRRMPGFRDISERQSGLMKYREGLENKTRVAQGQPLLPSPHIYVGEGAGSEGTVPFIGGRMRLGLPEGTLLKTLLIKGLGERGLLPDPAPAAPFRPAGLLGPGPIAMPPSQEFGALAGSEPAPPAEMLGYPSEPQPQLGYGGKVTATQPKTLTIRDPKTGKMKRIYTGESK